MKKCEIIPGSPAWEDVCRKCGVCCLVKYIDACGNIFLTRVACDNMDLATGKCTCYSADVEKRGTAKSGCVAHNGGVLNLQSLKNDYLVPGCCAYVQRFVGKNRLRTPDIRKLNLVHEHDVINSDHPELSEYIIPDSWRQFKYNPHINKNPAMILRQKEK